MSEEKDRPKNIVGKIQDNGVTEQQEMIKSFLRKKKNRRKEQKSIQRHIKALS